MNNVFIYLFLNLAITGSIIQCSQPQINIQTTTPPILFTSAQFSQSQKERERACLMRLALERAKKRREQESNT